LAKRKGITENLIMKTLGEKYFRVKRRKVIFTVYGFRKGFERVVKEDLWFKIRILIVSET
jgi:hypothetical protein